MPRKRKNLIDQKFGMLLVVSEAPIHRTPKGKTLTRWNCQCDCGKEIIVYTMDLTRRKNLSCGCRRLSYGRKYDPRTSSASIIFRATYNDGDLSLEDFMVISQLPCHYCGALLSNSYMRAWKNRPEQAPFDYNGLDRINSNLPHNKNNVVPCCKQCNWAKRDLSYDDFLNWVKKLYEYQFNKNSY